MISGCSQKSSTSDISNKLNEKVDFSIIVPKFDQYVLNYAAIETAPVESKHKTITLGYSLERNESTKLTKKEKETLKKGQNKDVLLGNPKNENHFYIKINDSEKNLNDSNITIISGYEVQYYVGDKHAKYVLNTEDASYSLNVIFSQTNKQTADKIVERTVKQITKTE